MTTDEYKCQFNQFYTSDNTVTFDLGLQRPVFDLGPARPWPCWPGSHDDFAWFGIRRAMTGAGTSSWRLCPAEDGGPRNAQDQRADLISALFSLKLLNYLKDNSWTHVVQINKSSLDKRGGTCWNPVWADQISCFWVQMLISSKCLVKTNKTKLWHITYREVGRAATRLLNDVSNYFTSKTFYQKNGRVFTTVTVKIQS